MNQQLAQMIAEHSGEIITFVATSLIALIKRKLDLRKLKKQGKI